MEQEVKVSYKDKLVQIYKDLDSVNIEEVQSEIDSLKKEIEVLIKQCDESNAEKEKILINDVINENFDYKPIQEIRKEAAPIIIEKGNGDKKALVRDIITLVLLIVAALLITLGVVLS